MKSEEIKSRVYVLMRSERPISCLIQARSTKRKPLLYFDKDKGYNRELRYAPNQKSPFVDEQDGTALLEPVVFEDGMLVVPQENQVLQKFLFYHPEKGKTFQEKDPEQEAIEAIKKLEIEEDAILAVRDLNINQLKTLLRIGTREDVSRLTISEIKHNARVLARNQPHEVIRILNDPLLKVQDIVARAFEQKILNQKGKMRDVYINNKTGGKTVSSRLLSVPPSENHIFTVSKFLQSNEGLPVLELINRLIEQEEE
jgi:hypothetical protein